MKKQKEVFTRLIKPKTIGFLSHLNINQIKQFLFFSPIIKKACKALQAEMFSCFM